MTRQQTPVYDPAGRAPGRPHWAEEETRKGRGKTIAEFSLSPPSPSRSSCWCGTLVFRGGRSKGEVMTDFVTRGSIQSMVEGAAPPKPRTPPPSRPAREHSGALRQEGDQVTAGQRLYRMDDTTARDAVSRGPEVGGQLQ